MPRVHEHARHFADAHFPGLYSIVLDVSGDLLRRVFVARPGMLHSDLCSDDSPFLWHTYLWGPHGAPVLLGSATSGASASTEESQPK